MFSKENYPHKAEGLYIFLATLFTIIVIVSNLVTVKLIRIPFFYGMPFPCGLITYPLTFLVGDLVTEIYGQKRAKFIVYTGFIMAFVSYAIIKLALLLPPDPNWVSLQQGFGYQTAEEYQKAFVAVFDLNGIALIGSILAYASAQIMDIRLFSFFGELTKKKHLWFRNAASTLISQVIDTLIVNVLVLHCGLKLELETVIHISAFGYLYKAAFTIVNVPLFYLVVAQTRRFLGENFINETPLLYRSVEAL